MTPAPDAFDPEALFAALNDAGVRYVVIGGIAATLHGSPVKTGDSDICPERTAENLARLAAVLGTLEAGIRAGRDVVPLPTSPELLDSADIWNLRTVFGELDLAFRPAGTDGYEDLVRHVVVYDLDGVLVPCASLDDVIRSKVAAGRAKDREHLLYLQALRDEVARPD